MLQIRQPTTRLKTTGSEVVVLEVRKENESGTSLRKEILQTLGIAAVLQRA
jgi:hypothetical protein